MPAGLVTAKTFPFHLSRCDRVVEAVFRRITPGVMVHLCWFSLDRTADDFRYCNSALRAADFKASGSTDPSRLLRSAGRDTVALPSIVSMSPPGYPSAWLRPQRAASVSPDKVILAPSVVGDRISAGSVVRLHGRKARTAFVQCRYQPTAFVVLIPGVNGMAFPWVASGITSLKSTPPRFPSVRQPSGAVGAAYNFSIPALGCCQVSQNTGRSTRGRAIPTRRSRIGTIAEPWLIHLIPEPLHLLRQLRIRSVLTPSR